MATTVDVPKLRMKTKNNWIYDRNWDLKFISLSVVLVAMPYLIYIGMINMETLLQPVADIFGTSVESASRNLINFSVALLIGGPHMYATWTRTFLNHDYNTKHRRMLWFSLVIPVIVISLALFNLTLLLTIFFFWASIHVLHQIIYIVGLYNNKKKVNLTIFSRVTDYAVVLTALYPIAIWKIVYGGFAIGENDLGELINQFLPVGPWMVWLVAGVFGISLVLWIAKSIMEIREGTIHWPKTIFIGVTVTAAFFVPMLGNLDTAFQGMNVWHSFQYLALTWMLNHLIWQKGGLKTSPFVERLSATGGQRKYYLFNILLTAGTVALAVGIFLILRYPVKMDFDGAFDRAYYIAVLSFLWIHYYLDHFLFARPEVITS